MNNRAIPQHVEIAKSLYRVGDKLRGVGAREKYGDVTLTSTNFVNVRINEKGTVVCGKNGIVLWNEGLWAEVCGRQLCPPPMPENAFELLNAAKRHYPPGTKVLGEGPRRTLGSCTIGSGTIRVNAHGNLIAGDFLIWSRKEGWAPTTNGTPSSLGSVSSCCGTTKLSRIAPPSQSEIGIPRIVLGNRSSLRL